MPSDDNSSLGKLKIGSYFKNIIQMWTHNKITESFQKKYPKKKQYTDFEVNTFNTE